MLSIILSKAKQLEFLILKDIHLAGTKSEWIELTDILKSHCSLLHLSLDNYLFEDSEIDLGGFILALSCIPKLRLVEILHHKHQVKASQFSPSTLKSLLKEASALQVLRLCGLNIGDDHIVEMATSLKTNQTLRELCLWQTKITEMGVESLSESLVLNTSVAVLNLNDNLYLKNGGCRALFDCFRKSDSCSIGELYIGCQDMDKSSRNALLGLIEKNISIKKLEVCFTWPHETTVIEITRFIADVKKAANAQNVLEYLRLYYDHPDDKAFGSETDDAYPPRLQWELECRRAYVEDVSMEDIEDFDKADD